MSNWKRVAEVAQALADGKRCDAPSGIPSTDLLASRAIARLAIASAMTKAVATYATDGKDAARDFIRDRCRSLVDELIPKNANKERSGSSADADG